MTEQTTTPTRPKKDPTIVPCATCGSEMHPTGHHDSGAPPVDGIASATQNDN